MVRRAAVLAELAGAPFRGSDAVRRGVISWAMLRGPAWLRLLPDVYIRATDFDPADHRMLCQAAALTLRPGGAVDRYSAAHLWGLNLLRPGAPVSMSVSLGERPAPHPGRRVTRAALAADDITQVGGIPVTTPVRTAFDLGRQKSRRDAVVALDAMCHRHLVTVPAVIAYADRQGCRFGVARLRDHLALTDPRSESPTETLMRLLLSDAGLPPAVPQYEVRRADRTFVGRVDLAFPRWKIAIEYEGDHHREKWQFRRDVARLNALREAGWLVLRFTADDLFRRPRDVVRQVAVAIVERRRTMHR